jgi:hypothetical protein
VIQREHSDGLFAFQDCENYESKERFNTDYSEAMVDCFQRVDVIIVQMTTVTEVKMSCMLGKGLLLAEVTTAEKHGILLKFSDFEHFFSYQT